MRPPGGQRVSAVASADPQVLVLHHLSRPLRSRAQGLSTLPNRCHDWSWRPRLAARRHPLPSRRVPELWSRARGPRWRRQWPFRDAAIRSSLKAEPQRVLTVGHHAANPTGLTSEGPQVPTATCGRLVSSHLGKTPKRKNHVHENREQNTRTLFGPKLAEHAETVASLARKYLAGLQSFG